MEQELRLPELGEGIDKAVVACWHIREGDKIKKGEEIVEVVTDKASFCIPCPCDGVLDQIIIKEGVQVKVGELLGRIRLGENRR